MPLTSTATRRLLQPRLIAAAAAIACAQGAYAQADAPAVATVTVNGAKEAAPRSSASIGPLGEVAVLDTPYSVNLIPHDLIVDQQLISVTDTFRYLPFVQGDGARPQTRGIQGSVAQNTRIDGLNAVATTDYAVEQFEQVEVLNGLSGALYGPANPAGTFNYIQKRPTAQRQMRFNLGYLSHDRVLRVADLSDRAATNGAFGYRVNLLGDSGTGYTTGSKIRRQMASMALDYRFAPGTVLESNFTHYRYVAKGLPATFALAAGQRFPDALDPTTGAYAVTQGGNDNTTDTATVKFRHQLSHDWKFSAGLLRQIADRESTGPTNTLTSSTGAYTTTIGTATASRFSTDSNFLYLNGSVDSGAIHHALSVGTTGVSLSNYNPVAGATTTLGRASLAAPVSFGLTGVPDFERRYQSAKATQQSLIVADDLTFSPQWSALLAASRSWLSAHNYNLAGLETSSSSDQGTSGSASLVFKPRANMSTYITYADSLQQGDTAPAGSVNAGNVLDPYRSKQWEVGYKVAVGDVNASIAAFRITRPYAYVAAADNLYRIAGEQRNDGVELMLDGHVTRDLALFGGFTWLDPRLNDTGNASTEGKRIVGLPRYALSLLATYEVPQVPGLSTRLNLRAVDARATDNANTSHVAGYGTLDWSAAWRTALMGYATTFRVSVNNLTGKQYWTNIVPGGLNGYSGTGNASAQLGAPRTAIASIQVEL
jgi:iron complex outermembrane receptor protein